MIDDWITIISVPTIEFNTATARKENLDEKFCFFLEEEIKIRFFFIPHDTFQLMIRHVIDGQSDRYYVKMQRNNKRVDNRVP